MRLVPVAGLAGAAVALAWAERGSIASPDWLAYLLVALGIAGAVLAARAAHTLGPLVLLSAAALAGLAVWALVSAAWSPAPALARDEALLRVLYLVALLVPAATLRLAGERMAATAFVVGSLALVALAAGVHLLRSDSLDALFFEGRPYFPLTYPNAQAAFFAVGIWPAIALAARRDGAVAGRALALAAAVACAGGVVTAQSKGAVVALGLSAVVLFAVSSWRLRMLVPAGLVFALSAAAFIPLTEPIRAEDAELGDAVQGAAYALFGATAAAAVLGLAYALLDRRVRLSQRTTRAAGVLVWIAIAGAAAAGVVAFLSEVESPRDYLAERWDELQSSSRDQGFSHFTTLGSNRSDFWRVAVGEFEENPLVGSGARGFGASYLREGNSIETPARAHSLPLDVLAEEGAVGAALLLLALAPLLGLAIAAGRASPLTAALAAAAVYWLAHAALDWNWTVPAAGLPFFLLLGIAVARPEPRLPGPAAAALGVAVVAVVVVAGATWFSARLTQQALQSPETALRDLERAERLDPLSTQPFVARWQLSQTPDARIAALQRALDREPDSFPLRYFLGLSYRDAGQIGDAREQLRIAKRLGPRVEAVDTALESLGG